MTDIEIFIMIFWSAIGLIVGSFLNVCIYRIPAGESIVKPPSHCPKCGRMLGWIELVPVLSWVFLGGRCKGCKERISPRYALVEALTGALFLGAFIKFGLTPEMFLYSAFAAVMVAVFFIDYDHKIIHDGTVVAATVIAAVLIVLNIFRPVALYGSSDWWAPFLGLLPGALVLLLVAAAGRLIYSARRGKEEAAAAEDDDADEGEAMGTGDILLAIPVGLALGWRMTLLAIYIAVVAAGAVGLILILARKKNRKDSMPFGPFIVAGALAALYFGPELAAMLLPFI